MLMVKYTWGVSLHLKWVKYHFVNSVRSVSVIVRIIIYLLLIFYFAFFIAWRLIVFNNVANVNGGKRKGRFLDGV